MFGGNSVWETEFNILPHEVLKTRLEARGRTVGYVHFKCCTAGGKHNEVSCSTLKTNSDSNSTHTNWNPAIIVV